MKEENNLLKARPAKPVVFLPPPGLRRTLVLPLYPQWSHL